MARTTAPGVKTEQHQQLSICKVCFDQLVKGGEVVGTTQVEGMPEVPLPMDWSVDIHRVFREAGVRQVGHVPDSGLTNLISLCENDPEIASVSLTSEEEGIALSAGAWLGGQPGAVLMQSSGVGNCVNAFSLARECRFPVLLIISMRGEWGEFNPWQVHMGQAARPVIELAGGTVFNAGRADEVGPAVSAAARLVFKSYRLAAVTLSQQLIGVKTFGGEG